MRVWAVAVAVVALVSRNAELLATEAILAPKGMFAPVTGMPADSTAVPPTGRITRTFELILASVRVSESALKVISSVRVTAPAPKDRLLPETVKPCFQTISLALASVTAVPATLRTVTPEPSWN